MATYVFSDIHGHVEPLRRALERINPTESDVFYCLGDMIDRGPSSLATIKTVRSLPNCTVLMGNHEQLALQALNLKADIETQFMWQINGGDATLTELKTLPEEEYCELIGWLQALPLYAIVEVQGRDFVLVHAGVKSNGVPLPTTWNKVSLEQYLSKQSENDLLWIREEFWQLRRQAAASWQPQLLSLLQRLNKLLQIIKAQYGYLAVAGSTCSARINSPLIAI